jgi:FkbM family methyltransferase
MSGSLGGSRRKGLRWLEMITVVIVVAVLSGFATLKFIERRLEPHLFFSQPALLELEDLRQYGPHHYSLGFEEWIVRDFFQDRRNGVFLDVGANHPIDRSNTYFLEHSLGWSGLAIDALAEFAESYEQHRPRTRFVAMFASDTPDERVQLFVPDNKLVSSGSREFTERYGRAGVAREVPTTTLTAALDQAGIQKVDFLSMDIELAEPAALAGFDIARFRPGLVCIESHPEIRQQIMDFFTQHGYELVGKYLRVDPHNLYFAPRS